MHTRLLTDLLKGETWECCSKKTLTNTPPATLSSRRRSFTHMNKILKSLMPILSCREQGSDQQTCQKPGRQSNQHQSSGKGIQAQPVPAHPSFNGGCILGLESGTAHVVLQWPVLLLSCAERVIPPNLAGEPQQETWPVYSPGLHCTAVQCSAVQCSAVQCSAVQCSAVQCSSIE